MLISPAHTLVKTGLIVSIALLLVSCGGGSGGSKNSAVPTNTSSSSSSLSSHSSSLSSSSSSSSSYSSSLSSVPVADVSVDLSTSYQTIDGFGAALPMWVGSANGMLTTAEVRKAVGMGNDELGLSILRTMISPDSNSWAFTVNNLQEAKSYVNGVKILASPWSPPAYMKDNKSTINGGKLLLEHYGDYAAHLNNYVKYMSERSITIDVVSIQNEPDWHPDYDSCDWTGAELRNFVRDYGLQIQGTKLLVGESLRFNRAYTDPTLNDSVAVNNIDFVGGHLYSAESSGNLSPYPLAKEKGKPVWMTEWLSHEADGSGAAIWGTPANLAVWDETLDTMMRSVHKSMEANWSAYMWWWLRRFYSFIGDGDTSFGTTKGEILKRGWAFSHYSKFVRPGYLRVKVDKNSRTNGLEITAYKGDGKVVLVILNRTQTAVTDAVIDIPQGIKSAQLFQTSISQNRESAEINLNAQMATIDIASRSVSTLVLNF